jgi:opacity protein-like surface antigen
MCRCIVGPGGTPGLMAVRSSTLFAVVGLLLVALPQSARADRADAIAAFLASGAASGVLCWTGAMRESRDESDIDQEEREKSLVRRGPLLGMSLAYAAEAFESDVQSSFRSSAGGEPLNLSLKDSFGLKSRAGYRCNRWVSTEVQVEWLDGFDGTVFQDGAGNVASANFEPIAITTNVRGYYPIGDGRFQPFALFGGGVLTMKTKLRDRTGTGQGSSDRDTEFAIRAGGGLDFYATPNVVVTFESDYLKGFNKLNDIDYVTVGLGVQYRF